MTTFGSAHQFLVAVIGKRQIKDANDLPGKTIARTFQTENGKAVLHFLDDSFVAFEVLFGFDDAGDEEVAIASDMLSADALVTGHLIDRAEYDHYKTLEAEDFAAEAEARNRKEYERLKAIFEGGGNGGS